MKASAAFVGLACSMAAFNTEVARGFSISSVTVSPSNVVPAHTEVRLVIDIQTPSQGTWLYAPTEVFSSGGGIRVDVFPTSGMLTAIGSLRETVSLGVLPAGTHHYEVAIHPNFTVNWGIRTNRGSFTVLSDVPAPTVSIHAQQFRTAEPCPVCLVAPGVFVVSRTGPTTSALDVHLTYDGTATAGTDYRSLPARVTIPAGTNATHMLVLANDDFLVEGPEIVRATLVAGTAGYAVNHYSKDAMVVIGDDEPGGPEIRLDIAQPKEGDHFAAGTTIEISAFGVWTRGEVDRPVQFYAGKLFIGESSPPAFGRPTIPGLPSVHTVFWTNPPVEQHALTARFEWSPDVSVTSPPVNISVGGDTPVVFIEATQPIAEESSYPYRRLAFRGEFTISRHGPTNDSLNVFVHASGTATAGEDYPGLPFLVQIPAGSTSTRIEVVPNDDGIPEGIETVIATLSHCPPDMDPPMGIPCYGGYEIDQAHAQATVFIRDNGITEATVEITRPDEGAKFSAGHTILIDAVAIDLNGYIDRVEFWNGTTLIGVSEITFIRAPDPGTPVYHSFEWQGAGAGVHVLTARAVATDGSPVISAPVHISVGDELPVVTVTAPDCFAVEPTSNATLNTATFRIRRTGPTNDPLVVAYALRGTAENGVDYEWLSGLTTIPAGHRAVNVVVRPLADDAVEGLESVALRVVEPPPPGPDARVINPYRVGRPSVAGAVISDGPWPPLTSSTRCTALADGLRLVCFAAEAGHNYRIEGSGDLRNWETLGVIAASDGAVHFVDAEAADHHCRFYRMTPESTMGGSE